MVQKILNEQLATVDPMDWPGWPAKKISADVLRLDKIHPVISGNKWFKLKYYLHDALQKKHEKILTFGGAYSNHLMAMARVAKEAGLGSIGIVRGERPASLSAALQSAEADGMQLEFSSRQQYKMKNEPAALARWLERFPGAYAVAEGGAGAPGIQGSSEILGLAGKNEYSHILCAAGTGTMCLGLAAGSAPGQQVLGISVLRGMEEAYDQAARCQIIHGYHFGGYAKKNTGLIDFMNGLYRHTGIPTDFVYTGKLFYAAIDLAEKGCFTPGSRLLIIHSGGLAGNCSLRAGLLDY
jgi:1-aminocyclopropane-1-carboxylate deaminase